MTICYTGPVTFPRNRLARAHSQSSSASRRLKALATLVPLLFANELHAQQSMAPVVVTATRFESQAAEFPIAAQVLTADDIRNSSATTLVEVLSKIGGVHTRNSLTGLPDAPLDLRGFGVTASQNTLVLVNGQRLSENEGTAARISSIPVDSIERIEILRGAGAVLYGAGATGGTINIITRSPIQKGVSGNGQVLAGSYGLRDLRAGVQVGDGNKGVRLNAQHYEKDGYRANSRARFNTASGELRFGGRDEFVAVNFSADDQKSRLPGIRTQAQLVTDPRGTITPDDYINSESHLLSLRGEKRLGAVTLAGDIVQREKKGMSFGSIAGAGTSSANTDVEVTSFSPRLLWEAGTASLNNKLTFGLDWSEWSYSNKTVGTGFLSSQDQVGSQQNRAVYVRDELLFGSGTRLSLGVRREKVSQSDQDNLTPRPRTTTEPRLNAHEIALQQDLGAGYSAYGRAGRSFRLATIDENRCLFAPCNLTLLKPQRSGEREVGMQWRAKDASLRIGLFDMDIDDEIHYEPYTGINTNLSPTRRRGLEIEGRFSVAKSLDLAVQYAHTQARFRSGTYTGFDGDLGFTPFNVDLAGKDVPLVPKDRLSLNLGWQATAATRLTYNFTYVGSQRYDNDQANNFLRMPSYTISDVKISHDIGAWRIAAGINNLFDKAYYTYAVANISATPSRFNAYPEDRRNAYVSAEYRF
ncbi:iron complex outermembrane receptor protein [Paucimonas lemoignei]|uniref:Iron complex outermembrane receptor protein n=1 Tax=Paucimonas lemoignei TaxID=29443 RepID=A0A4R3HT47_PAULE|nr:TonB-dependent receptor [Paucimonas lemoignei]TCS33994.1 iron complex outermembrane receptor protein [Paucimonas lemoignei]